MDDGKSDRGSLPEHAGSIEPDRVGDDISSLTRRSFLVGAGSVAGAYATGAFAETMPVHRWSVYRAPDPRADGRSVVAVCYDDRTSREEDLRWCFLPEVSFSEYAKATIQPLTSLIHTRDVYDVQAVFSGIELARPENKTPSYFSLIFKFINPPQSPADKNKKDPQVEIAARNLLSPGERMLARLTLKEWRSIAPIAITDDQLGSALLNAVFSTRLRQPRSGKVRLSLIRPTEQDRRLIWRFRTTGATTAHAGGFAVVADPTAKLGDNEFRRAMVGTSSSVEMWRAHSALDSDTQVQGAGAPDAASQSGAKTPLPNAAVDTRARAGTTNTMAKPTPARTMAQLTAFRPNESAVVLGENKLSNQQSNSLALGQIDIDDKRPVQLVRRDPSGYPSGVKVDGQLLKVAIETTVPIGSGELSVRTTRAKKTERKEGLFRLDQGTLNLSGAPDGVLLLDADFQLDCHNTSLLTAFGPFEVERPEDKRVRRRNALEFPSDDDNGAGSSQYELRRPVRLSVKDRAIKAFEATARVNSVGVALSKPSPPANDDHNSYRVDLGFPQGCEVLFRLFGLKDSANRRTPGRFSHACRPASVRFPSPLQSPPFVGHPETGCHRPYKVRLRAARCQAIIG